MDAAGVGKIVTISQAVFEGMTPRTDEQCLNYSQTGPWPGGCRCKKDEDCIISEYKYGGGVNRHVCSLADQMYCRQCSELSSAC